MALFRSLQENLEILQGVVVVLEAPAKLRLAIGELGDFTLDDPDDALVLVVGGKEQPPFTVDVRRVHVSRATGLVTITFRNGYVLRPATDKEITAMKTPGEPAPEEAHLPGVPFA